MMEGTVEGQVNSLIAYIVVGGLALFAAIKGVFTCHGWWKELRDARKAKKQEEIDRIHATADARVSGERDIGDRLKRIDDLQDWENRILAKQLDEEKVKTRGYEITIERQRKALVDCWQGHPTTQHMVDVLVELEKASERQDQLEARIKEEGK